MKPEEIKALRAELKCTAKELAAALSLDQATVMKWESEELFPTKKHVDAMTALREKGPGGIPRKAKGASPSPMRVLADPGLWELVRKLVAHKKLRDEVTKLAATYADPADELSHPEKVIGHQASRYGQRESRVTGPFLTEARSPQPA